MSAYNKLIKRLDTFIRKYYKNRLLRGLLITISISVFAFLAFVTAEYFGRFTGNIRMLFYYTFAALIAATTVYYFIIPLLKLFRIGKVLSYRQAAEVIRKHFPKIEDKILNALELYESNPDKNQADSLILAAVNQKIKDTELFSFKKAVDYRENFKYLKYALPLLLILFALLAFSPAVINESTKRIINHDIEYETPAPFDFILLNENLDLQKGADFEIKLQIQGEYIPDELFVNIGGNSFLMKKSKTERSKFSYKIKNLNNSIQFNFSAEEYRSKSYQLSVLPTPVLLKFDIKTKVPKYTGEEDKTYTNTGDITVPQGTKLIWSFYTKDTDSLQLLSGEITKLKKTADLFSYQKTAMRDFFYTVSLKNSYFTNRLDVKYNISVRPDLKPAIQVEDMRDTTNYFIHYFNGRLADDYGLRDLSFNYRVVEKGTLPSDDSKKFTKDKLPLASANTKQQFYHFFDFSSFKISENQEIQYFFKIWDNDAVNGSKSAQTSVHTFTVPSRSEINDMKNTAGENVQSKLQQAKELSKEIQSDFERMRERNLNGEMSDWENRQMLKSISDKHEKMKNLMQEAVEENKNKNKMENTFNEQNEEILKKQEEIEKLMDELFTEEMKKLMEEINKLQEQFNQDQMQELMQDQEMTMEDIEDRLERNMELLKRYEVEQKVENAANELEKLSEEQQKLSQKTDKRKSDTDKISEEQKNLEERFQEAKEEYKKALEKNDELEQPMNMDKMNEEFKKIEDEFKKTQENLGKNRRNKASDSQQQNSKNMKKAAGKMKSMMQANSMQMQTENLETLRQIVDNLITFSFEQEALKDNIKQVSHRNPQYIELMENQIGLREEFSHINDSLTALAKRVPQISSAIQKETNIVNDGIKQSIRLLEERKVRTALNMQQKTMTSANNLALLLSEVLDQMQNQQQSGSGQGGKPQKKKGSKPSFESLKQMQQRLKKQMKQMLQQMKDGKLDKNAQNKKIAKMLAQQEIFRQMMQEMRSKKSLSPEAQQQLNQIEKLSDQIEKELVNKKITPELYERQKMITTRLLEAEKAENERETEKKRRSSEAEEKKYTSPEDFFRKNKKNQSIKEDLYRNNLILNRFYENLNNSYNQNIQK